MSDKPTSDEVIADLVNTVIRTRFRLAFSMELEASVSVAERHLAESGWVNDKNHWIELRQLAESKR